MPTTASAADIVRQESREELTIAGHIASYMSGQVPHPNGGTIVNG